MLGSFCLGLIFNFQQELMSVEQAHELGVLNLHNFLCSSKGKNYSISLFHIEWRLQPYWTWMDYGTKSEKSVRKSKRDSKGEWISFIVRIMCVQVWLTLNYIFNLQARWPIVFTRSENPPKQNQSKALTHKTPSGSRKPWIVNIMLGTAWKVSLNCLTSIFFRYL